MRKLAHLVCLLEKTLISIQILAWNVGMVRVQTVWLNIQMLKNYDVTTIVLPVVAGSWQTFSLIEAHNSKPLMRIPFRIIRTVNGSTKNHSVQLNNSKHGRTFFPLNLCGNLYFVFRRKSLITPSYLKIFVNSFLETQGLYSDAKRNCTFL